MPPTIRIRLWQGGLTALTIKYPEITINLPYSTPEEGAAKAKAYGIDLAPLFQEAA